MKPSSLAEARAGAPDADTPDADTPDADTPDADVNSEPAPESSPDTSPDASPDASPDISPDISSGAFIAENGYLNLILGPGPLCHPLYWLVRPIARAHGLRVNRLHCTGPAGSKGSRHVQFFLENPEFKGVSVEDCAALSREISSHLDVADLVKTRYTLEVGSSGLAKYLSHPDEFDRFLSFECHAELVRATPSGRRRYRGRLLARSGHVLTLQTEAADGDGAVGLDLRNLAKVRLVMNDRLLRWAREHAATQSEHGTT